MTSTMIHTEMPVLTITPEDVAKKFSNLRNRWAPSTNSSCQLYLPAPDMLNLAVFPHHVAVDWNDVSLEGMRIADFNGTGLRLLYREQGKVTRSQILDHKHPFQEVIEAFCSQLYGGFSWAHMPCDPASVNKYVLDLQLVVRLLKESFLSPEKPRLAPKVIFPADEVISEIGLREIPEILLDVDQGYGLSFSVEREGSKYVLKALGERGNLEYYRTADTPAGMMLEVYNYLASREAIERSSSYKFEQVYFRERAV